MKYQSYGAVHGAAHTALDIEGLARAAADEAVITGSLTSDWLL